MTLIEQPSGIAGADTPQGDTSGDSGVGALFDWLLLSLRALGDRELIRRTQEFEQRLGAERLTAAARVAGSSGDLVKDRKKARDLLGGSGRSRRTRNRDARRAAAVSANPSLGEKVADGSIAPDSLDALARAADADTGHIPGELIDEVTGLSPDQTDYAVDRHLEDTAECDEVNDKYRAQMSARSCRRRVRPAEGGKPDLATLTLEGPDAVIDRAWAQIQADADAAYRNAGGRDRPVGEHVPWEHRLFDAAIAYFNGTAGDDTQPAGNPPSSSTPPAGSKRAGNSRSGSKPPIVVSIRLDDVGLKPAIQHGTGPISSEVFQEYVSAGSPIYALFTDSNAQPLWLGRTRRHASVAQYLALVVRDGACVQCGASPQRCQAHHLIPWNAPAKGTTDIDQLAPQCGPCHRELHSKQPHPLPHHRAHRAHRLGHPTGHTGRNPTTPTSHHPTT